MTSLRAAVPAPLHGLARRGYLEVGRATAGRRNPPGMILVGASRSGTTSLFRALNDHPDVSPPPVNKGVRYFDLNYGRPWDWYLGHFPLRRSHRSTPILTYEASGYYLFHPFAVPRIAQHLPDAKIVVILRNPVERAHSAWKHESARGFEWEPFERALALEDERLEGEVERMRRDVRYQSFCHRHHSHRGRGEYAGQLERIYAHFPRTQVHVIQSERFFENGAQEYARLTEFLGLRPNQPASFGRHNPRPSSPMPVALQRRLAAHYQPHNERLESLLGKAVAWG